MTRIRKEILNSLLDQSQPRTAAQLHETETVHGDLASIYRGLQYLENKGLADSFSFRCSGSKGTERYYTAVGRQHRHYLHCSGCHHFFPIESCPLSPHLNRLAEKHEFTIESHTLTVVGKCRDCREEGTQP